MKPRILLSIALLLFLFIPFAFMIDIVMLFLLLVAETKNQWARDDPAFVVICSFLLAVAASAFCAAYVLIFGLFYAIILFSLMLGLALRCHVSEMNTKALIS